MCFAVISPAALGTQPAPSEWTLEQARQCWQPMVRPVQHVGVPGYQFQAAVMWDGALVFGPLSFRDLKVMQAELAPLGDNRLHVSIGYGEPMRLMDRRGGDNPLVTRHLEQGCLPIAHVVSRDPPLVWVQTVFAHLLGRPMEAGLESRPGDVLVVHALFRVLNVDRTRRQGHLWLHFGDTSQVSFGYKCAQGAELVPAIGHHYEVPYGRVGDRVRYVLKPPKQGKLVWHDTLSPPVGAKSPARAVIEWAVELDANAEAWLHLLIPYGLVDESTARWIAQLDSQKQLKEVRQYWMKLEHVPGEQTETLVYEEEAERYRRKLKQGPGKILTPDPFVNDYLAAVAGQMCQQVAFRAHSGVWMYKTSPNHYEGYWPCNAAKALPTLDFRGLSWLSRPVLQSFIAQQTNDVRGMDKGVMGRAEGLKGEGYAKIHGFLGNFGEWTANPLVLSHGLGLWALATHYRITRDARWLGDDGRRGSTALPRPGSPLQAMLDGFDWVSTQRRRTMREVDGKPVDYWGLLPAASAHDWLAGNTIFNDAFCIYGMAEVVRLLREIGHPRAGEMAGELAAYQQCLRERYAAARDRARRVPLPDGGSIPYVPRMVQELDWARPDWTYTGYGPLRAGAWGALDPKDELVSQALAFLEAGLPKGEGAYFSAPQTALAEAAGRRPNADANWADINRPEAERHYLWRHYVEYETMWPVGGPLFLARDDLPRFFEWLFNNLAAAIHEDWRVGVESLDGVPSCAPGDGERWQCIRKMFVHEREQYVGSPQSLWLFQAIPRSWLKPGDRLLVREMGTCLGGRVNLEMQVAPDGNSVRATARWKDLAVLPTSIMVRLRSGDGRPLRSVEVNGKPAKVEPGDLVQLPAVKQGEFRVVGRFD